jgi:hypothetical protein
MRDLFRSKWRSVNCWLRLKHDDVVGKVRLGNLDKCYICGSL